MPHTAQPLPTALAGCQSSSSCLVLLLLPLLTPSAPASSPCPPLRHYKGSLTTPPCQTKLGAHVEWFVMQTPVTIAVDQMYTFTSYFANLEKVSHPVTTYHPPLAPTSATPTTSPHATPATTTLSPPCPRLTPSPPAAAAAASSGLRRPREPPHPGRAQDHRHLRARQHPDRRQARCRQDQAVQVDKPADLPPSACT